MKTFAFSMLAAAAIVAAGCSGGNGTTVIEGATEPVSAGTDTLTIQGSKGRLAAVLRTPAVAEGKSCPMVLLLHGFSGNKDSMLERTMADSLASRGIASLRFDFNGHGQSDGDFVDMTVPNEIEDLKAVYDYAAALPYVSSIALSGHSQGGVVAAMSAGELGTDKVAAVVLFAPAAVLRDDAIRGSTMGAFYNPLDPPESVDLYGGLKLGREYIKTAFSLPIYETAAKYTGPACIIHGTGDRVVPYTYGERFHDIWPGSALHIIPGEDHMFFQDLTGACAIAVEFLAETLL